MFNRILGFFLHPSITVKLATTESEKAAYKFRYKIYIETMNKKLNQCLDEENQKKQKC